MVLLGVLSSTCWHSFYALMGRGSHRHSWFHQLYDSQPNHSFPCFVLNAQNPLNCPTDTYLVKFKLSMIKLLCLTLWAHPLFLSHSAATHAPPSIFHTLVTGSTMPPEVTLLSTPSYFSTQSNGGWMSPKWNPYTLEVRMDQGLLAFRYSSKPADL